MTAREKHLHPKIALAKKSVSWFVVVLGCALGFYGLLIAGQRYVSSRDLQWWLEELIPAVGLGFRGIVLLAASFTAIRHRRRAGIVLLFAAPIAATCLAFPSNFYFTGEHGEIFWPRLLTVLTLELLFYFPCLGLLIAIRNRFWGLSVFFILSVLLGKGYASSPWTEFLFPALPKYTILCVGLGLFWLLTERFGWPPLRAARPISLKARIGKMAVCLMFVASLDIAATLILAGYQSYFRSRECGGRALFAESLGPGHAVFTVRLVRVGHVRKISGRWVGEWAIGFVQEKFWGVPWTARRFVLLANSIFWEGETYFLDGHPADGMLTRFLPIIETESCTRTRPLPNAALELRAAREGRPAKGAKILGSVTLFERYSSFLTPPKPPVAYAGAKVRLIGSSGTRTATTDAQGIYEFIGLPAEDYTVTLDLPETQTLGSEASKIDKEWLAQKKFSEQSFVVAWKGSVEGSTTDSASVPARVDVKLQRVGDPELGFGQPVGPWKEASWKIGEVAPGRYFLRINPSGPSANSPYAASHFTRPGSSEPNVFEIAAGQHLENVKVVVSRLPELTRHIRVVWRDGKPVQTAVIHVAYENTQEYEELGSAIEVERTDDQGNADIKVFGNSKVRIFAEQYEHFQPGPLRYSQLIERNADKLPETLNLVLSSGDPPEPY